MALWHLPVNVNSIDKEKRILCVSSGLFSCARAQFSSVSLSLADPPSAGQARAGGVGRGDFCC